MATTKVSGIYAIVNLTNGKRYVGSSLDIEKRWREHRRDLTGGKHHSVALQRAWSKYGASSFEFRIIELSARSLLIEREQVHIDAGCSYNIRPTANSNGPLAEETRKRISDSKRGKPNLKTRGRPRPEETRQKLRLANLGKRHPLTVRLKRCSLTEDQVRQVLKFRSANQTFKEIGAAVGIDQRQVGRICRRERYEWVDPEVSVPDVNRKRGPVGYRLTDEQKTKRRQTFAAKREAKIASGEIAPPATAEQKTENRRRAAEIAWARRKSDGNFKGAPKSEAHKRALSEAKKQLYAGGYKHPPRSEAHSQALASATRASWSDPENRRKRVEAIKASYTPELRLLRSEQSKAMWAAKRKALTSP